MSGTHDIDQERLLDALTIALSESAPGAAPERGAGARNQTAEGAVRVHRQQPSLADDRGAAAVPGGSAGRSRERWHPAQAVAPGWSLLVPSFGLPPATD